MRNPRHFFQQKTFGVMRATVALWFIAMFSLIGIAHSQSAKPNTDPIQQEKEGRALASDLRNQKPEHDFTTTGLLKTRDASGRRLQQHVSLHTITTSNSWQAIYEAGPSAAQITTKLTIVHFPEAPNQYLLAHSGPDGHLSDPVAIPSEEAAVSFAGTEFWLMDLGMDFSHWPNQKIIKREMRKSRPCKVLESTNPNPQVGSYSRMLSWIDNETGGLLRAEAYDASRKLLKEFSLRSFSKVNGHWELKEIEIRNALTDATTRLEFDLEIAEQ
jgi:hypothetical protein